jgi:ubiquitin carboxyl-terminal hydrolase 5/13
MKLLSACVDIHNPILQDSTSPEGTTDDASVQTIVSFVFQEDVACTALKASVRFFL